LTFAMPPQLAASSASTGLFGYCPNSEVFVLV
jgi:hypothetical protein